MMHPDSFSLFLAFAAGCLSIWFVGFLIPGTLSKLAEDCMWSGKEKIAEKLLKLRLLLVHPADFISKSLGVPITLCPLMLARTELATCLMVLAKFEEAAKLHADDCETFEKMGSLDHHYASSLGRLAALKRLSGDLKESDRLFKRALVIAERCYEKINFGADGYEKLQNNVTVALTAEVFFGAGDLMDTLQRYEEAKNLRARASEIVNRTFNDADDPYFTSYGLMLGKAHMQLGQYDEALRLITQAVDVRRHAFHKNHTLLISGEQGLGKLFLLQGKLGEAEPLLVSAVQRTNEWNADYAEHLADLAQLRSKQDKHAEALQMFSRSLALYEKIYGLESPELLKVLEPYQHALVAARSTELAETVAERCAHLSKKLLV